MDLAKSIIALLKDEGYAINEAIEDGLEEFLALVEDENEGGISDPVEVDDEVDVDAE